jgi:hypothetical protein
VQGDADLIPVDREKNYLKMKGQEGGEAHRAADPPPPKKNSPLLFTC